VPHRGVRMTAPGAARFMLHVSVKPVATDWIGSQAWPGAAEGMAWHRFMQTPTVQQLSVLGFPEPGHPYWTEETLRGVVAHHPLLDMTPWREAARDAQGRGHRGDASPRHNPLTSTKGAAHGGPSATQSWGGDATSVP